MSMRIVLVGTTHPGNIGAVARAMKNMGLTDLALVAAKNLPHAEGDGTRLRCGGCAARMRRLWTRCRRQSAIAYSWPARAPAHARSTGRACSRASVRPEFHELSRQRRRRGGLRPGEIRAVERRPRSLRHLADDSDQSGLQFAESGDVRAGVLPTSCCMAGLSGKPSHSHAAEAPLATSAEMEHFYTHLERTLREVQFLDPDNPRHLMRRLRRLFIRAAGRTRTRSIFCAAS